MMKLNFILLMFAFLQVNASSFAQKVNIQVRNAAINEVFYKLTQQTGHTFTTDAALLKQLKPISLNMNNATIKEVLDKCFAGLDVKMFFNNDDKIIVIKKDAGSKGTAQPSATVSGKITDEQGEPLPGVNIRVKNSQTGAVSDVNGNYRISIPANAVLVFTFLGFAPQEVTPGSRTAVDVKLRRSSVNLEETVVIAYGTVAKRDLTGSVSTIKIEEIAQAPVTTFTQALAGRVAGLQVSTAEGQPGAMQDIIIRGPGSLSQDPSPLYIVDGFPMEDFDPATLNTNDIESISVLKDASASALYGSRAANGVVVIETVKGKAGKPKVSFNATYGYSKVRKQIEVMNPYEFVKYQSEFNSSIANSYYLQNDKTVEYYRNIQGMDWQDGLLQPSPMQVYDFSIRGGSNNTQYALSGSLFNNEGVIVNTGATRRQGRIALNHTLSSKLKADFIVNYAHNSTYGAQASVATSGSSSLANATFYNVFGYRPVFGNEDLDDLTLPDENVDDEVIPGDPNSVRVNPVKQALNTFNKRQVRAITANAALSYKIDNNFTLKITGNVRDNFREDEAFFNTNTHRGRVSPLNPNGVSGSAGFATVNGWLNENTLSYNKRFNKRHRIDALIGASAGGGKSKSYSTSVVRLINESIGMSGLDEGTPFANGAGSDNYTIASFFGRLNYNYLSKYLFTATFRADGSSKFPTDNKWGYFPSGAFAWNIDQEKFLKSIPAISTAKLRVSWGLTGNNRVSSFGYLPNLEFPLAAGYSFNNAYPTVGAIPAVDGLGNKQLMWETVEQSDLGLDLSFLKKRIEFNVDVYRRITHNMLLFADLPYATGFSQVFQNVGKLRNDGLEFTLNTQNIIKKDFRWSTSFNISFNENKVLKLNRGQSEMFRVNRTHYFWTDAFNISRVGEPAGQFWGYEWIGNYQYADFDEISPGVYKLKDGIPGNGSANVQPGDIKYKDVNGDGRISGEDQTIIGRGLPKHFGGFTNNFSYKNFDLNVFFQWNYGNHIYNANRLIFEGNGSSLAHLNQFASYADRWTPENQDSKNFRTGGGGPQGLHSSRVLEDGSYLRLKTLALTYNLPVKIIKRAGLSRLAINLSAQNLITWTKYTGFDPEVAVRNSVLTPGLDYSAYPQYRTFVAGIKAQF